MNVPRQQNISRNVVVVTDGYVDGEQGVFDYIRDNLGQSNLFSFGIGTSVNRYLIEGLAKAGMGEPFIVVRIRNRQLQTSSGNTFKLRFSPTFKFDRKVRT